MQQAVVSTGICIHPSNRFITNRDMLCTPYEILAYLRYLPASFFVLSSSWHTHQPTPSPGLPKCPPRFSLPHISTTRQCTRSCASPVAGCPKVAQGAIHRTSLPDLATSARFPSSRFARSHMMMGRPCPVLPCSALFCPVCSRPIHAVAPFVLPLSTDELTI